MLVAAFVRDRPDLSQRHASLAGAAHLSQRQVASSVGISLGKANSCLRALIAKGFVKVENYRNSGNQLAYHDLLTAAGAVRKAELTRKFLARKVKEYEALRLEIEGVERENAMVVDSLSTMRSEMMEQ